MEPNKSKINIEIGNNNIKSQINYKNINTTQSDKAANYNNNKLVQYIKPLLLLLEKAEQIISIINLPASSIDKYNQLKEISFKKCGLEYTPLVKNVEFIKKFQKNNNINNNNEENKTKYNEIIYGLSLSKNKLLDLIITFIEANNVTNIINNNNKDNKLFLKNSNEFNINCNLLKDEINKIVNNNINIHIKNSNSNELNEEGNLIYNDKEKLLNYISLSQQNITSILYEYDKKFNELKEAFLIQNSKIEFLNNYINKIDELISPIWNKYFNNEVDWFDPNKINDKHELKIYTKSHFLLSFMNQLFADNKNLMEALVDMEKKKNEAYNILKLPYIKKVIEKSNNLKNIENLMDKLKENKDKNKDMDIKRLINDGKELINCIKETIAENQENDELNNNNGQNNDDNYNNYNDDMNIFLGRLMNGVQNILNKVDISIKKDELLESMIKVNISKNKNINIDNSDISMNKTNMNININNSNMNISNAGNNRFNNKDISFVSSNNNDINSSKLQNMSFQVYQKKTNHISGGNVIINNNKNELENNDNKNYYESFDNKNNINKKIKVKLENERKIEEINKNNKKEAKELESDNDPINDKLIIKSINKIINDKIDAEVEVNKNLEITNAYKNNDENIKNENKCKTIGYFGNNIGELENSQNSKIHSKTIINKSNELKDNTIIKEDIQKKKDITDEGLEELKNMVLEDFKSRINEEKENNE